MTPKKKNPARWLIWLPAVLLLGGLLAGFVRVQTHTEDPKIHLSREVLQHEYVPRPEYDAKTEAQMDIMREIRTDVREIRATQKTSSNTD